MRPLNKTRLVVSLVALAGLIGVGTSATRALADHPVVTIWDDFSAGFKIGTPDAKWFYFGTPDGFQANNGVTSVSGHRLTSRSPGTNPATGEPAYTLSGTIDHTKWLVYANKFNGSYPGWKAELGEELVLGARIGGRTFGTDDNPFGAAVPDDDDDLRLASTAMSTADFETYTIFSFFMTNKRLYVWYERLPFLKSATYDYAAFNYGIPVANRSPGDFHNLAVAFNKQRGTVRWLVEGVEVFKVTQIGRRLPSSTYLYTDHGGPDETVSPNQLALGMGSFSLLDGYRPNPTGKGLVHLFTYPYFKPGTTTPLTFVDEANLLANRLFGQGAEVQAEVFAVARIPTP
jgi:hypothetical protein